MRRTFLILAMLWIGVLHHRIAVLGFLGGATYRRFQAMETWVGRAVVYFLTVITVILLAIGLTLGELYVLESR